MAHSLIIMCKTKCATASFYPYNAFHFCIPLEFPTHSGSKSSASESQNPTEQLSFTHKPYILARPYQRGNPSVRFM
jgi:hypothetical protein